MDQERLDREYEHEKKEAKRLQDEYDDNKTRVFNMIIEKYCTEDMRNRLRDRKDYHTTIRDDPIKLLQAIREYMQRTDRSEPPMVTYMRVMHKMASIHQGPDESLSDYIAKIREAYEVAKGHHVGNHILDEAIEQSEEYKNETDATKKQEMKTNATQQMLGTHALINADPKKYGTLQADIRSNFAQGTKEYPKSLDAAMEMLHKHQWDQTYYDNKKSKREKDDDESTKNEETTSQTMTPGDMSFAQQQFCDKCGGDHMLKDCPDKSHKPKSEWAIAKLREQHLASMAQTATQHEPTPTTMYKMSMCTMAGQHTAGSVTSKVKEKNTTDIVWDSGSTLNVFNNPAYLKNIRKASQPITMLTNAGPIIVDQVGDFAGLTKVWYSPHAIANIVGWEPNRITHKFTMDDDHGVVYARNKSTQKVTKFQCSKSSNGLAIRVPLDPKDTAKFADSFAFDAHKEPLRCAYCHRIYLSDNDRLTGVDTTMNRTKKVKWQDMNNTMRAIPDTDEEHDDIEKTGVEGNEEDDDMITKMLWHQHAILMGA